VTTARSRLASVFAMLAFASPALAGLLPDDEAMEVMLEMEAVETTFLARYFPPTQISNLSFTNELDVAGKTLSFQLAPGSVYQGIPVSINAVAAFNNGDSMWHLTSHVLAGTYAWQVTGTAKALPPPDPFDPPWLGIFDTEPEPFPLPSPPNPTPLDIGVNVSYTNTAAQTLSEATYSFSQFGVTIAQTTVYDHLTMQGPDKGKWKWDMPAALENGNAFRVNGQGNTPLMDGPGTSVFQIAPVPEPSAILMLGSAGIFISVLRRTRTSRICAH